MNSDGSLQFGHIGLSVVDLEKSRRFYEDLLGFTVMHESHEEGHISLFLGDGKQVSLTLWQRGAGEFSMENSGLHHLAFMVKSMDEVRKFEAKLQKAGVKFEYPRIVPHAKGADSGGIFFYDPDGIRLEIFSPTGAKDLPEA